MRTRTLPIPLISTLLAAAVVAYSAPAAVDAAPVRPTQAGPTDATFVPGEAIVRFEAGTTPADRREARADAAVEFERSLPIGRSQVVDVDGAVGAAVERLERQPGVAFAQPNYRYHALASAPDDTFFGDLWGLQDTDLPHPGVNVLPAWDRSLGAGQVVAVLDTGVALDHPDIPLWSGPGGTHGYDFVDGDPVPDDYQYHGTHVAGTIAARAGNRLGVAGVAPQAQIMAVRVLDGDGSGSTADIAAGIQYAVANGADVVNMSLGGPTDGNGDPLMSAAVSAAAAAEIVVVAAAGNDGANNDVARDVPCTLPQQNVICVAAVDETGDLAGFSNYGPATVDVGAPGTSILSAQPSYRDVWSDGLDSGAGWLTDETNGGLPWSFVASPRVEGTHSATDSAPGPYGAAVDDRYYAQSLLAHSTGTSLVGETGCKVRFAARYELEDDYDYLLAGARSGLLEDGDFFTGTTSNFAGNLFYRREASISDLDGMTAVRPQFILLSDESEQRDGAWVDDLRLRCRDDAYPDLTGDAGSYIRLSGTSMAAPHVAGIAALVRGAAPASGAVAVAEAIKSGGMPLGSLAGRTVTGRTVDADDAIAVALGESPAPQPQPRPQPPAAPSPLAPAPRSPTAPVPTPQLRPLAKPNLANAKKAIRVSRRGVFKYAFTAQPRLTGRARFRTRRKAVVARRKHVTIANRSFAVGRTGKVTLRIKLSKRKLRILRRNRKLSLRVTVTVRDTAGRTSRAAKRLTLKQPT